MQKSKRLSYTYILNCILLFCVIVWTPFQMVFLQIDAAGRSIILLSLLTFFVNLHSPCFVYYLKSKVSLFWFLWILYSFANAFLKHSPALSSSETYYTFFSSLFLPYVTMLCTAFAYNTRPLLTTGVLLAAVCVYTYIGAFMMEDGLVYGSSIEDAVNLGNDLALHALFIFFFLGLLSNQGVLSRSVTYVLYAIVFVLVFILAERKAIVASLIIIISFYLSNTKLTPRNIIFICIIALAFLIFENKLLDSLTVSRFRLITEDVKMPNNYQDNFITKLLGDRAYYYFEGFKIFKRYPICGIGLENFAPITNSDYRIHSEIMVQLTECGLAGSALAVMFHANIIKAVNSGTRGFLTNYIKIMLIGVLIAIYFIGLYSWLYDGIVYFVVFGICMSYMNNKVIRVRHSK